MGARLKKSRARREPNDGRRKESKGKKEVRRN